MHNRRCFPPFFVQFLFLLHVGVWWRLSLAASVHAATFQVDTTDDVAAATCDDAIPNDCSLRGAILKANARPMTEVSTVNVPAGTYVLSQESHCTFSVQPAPTVFFTTTQPFIPLCLSTQVTIQGAGAATTIIDGGQRARVLFVSANAVAELRGVTIANGLGSRDFGHPSLVAFPSGGGIMNEGTLTLTESIVRNNSVPPGAINGGGIYNNGNLTLLRSAVLANGSPGVGQQGGGIFNQAKATLTVANSTISDNSVVTVGGGIANNGGAVTITGSTISGNRTDGLGGGIFNGGFPDALGLLAMTNSTISSNISGSAGGGIAAGGFGDTHLHNVTITNNTGATNAGSGGGVTGGMSLQNTVIAGNRDAGSGVASDCSARLISQGYNLIQDPDECIITGDLTGNIVGQDAQLGPLGDYGGSIPTHALLAGSPAIDAGNPATPGRDAACAATDQRGFLRPLGATCDIGAFELADSTVGFSLSSIRPRTGGNSGSVIALMYGSGFAPGATVKLTRAGQADIVGAPMQGDVGGTAIAATFDLVGRALGPWDVVVRNPDGTAKTLAAGFTIEVGRAPELWVDVLGLRFLRSGRPSRFTILYGNRGNVDAVGAPLSFSFPIGYTANRFFAITPPPPQPGQVRDDWSQVPVDVLPGAPSGFINVPLLLQVVPAGFTGALQIEITSLPGTQDSQLLVALGDPLFHPGFNPEVVSDAIAGARAYLLNEGVTLPPALVPDLEQYVTTQFQRVKENGATTFVANLGARPQVYSMSQLHFDLIFFATARAAGVPIAAVKPQDWFTTTSRWFTALLSQLGPTEAQAQQNCPVISCKSGQIIPAGCSCGEDPNEPFFPPEVPFPPECEGKPGDVFAVFERYSNPKCRPTESNCEALGSHKVVESGGGALVCVPKDPPKTCPKDPLKIAPGKQCHTFPLRPRASFDPNDKVGALGATPSQFLLSATPLSYSIHFENLESAPLAAQEVVVTDQLDVQTLNLDTFSLGPLSFGGDTTLVPAPGVQQYTGGVDLRPEQNLIVTIRASLDKSTGVLTWRFTSIDPDTGQFTEDPEAGFLPPNVTSPEGEGSVSFTVEPKSGLATGTSICNQASIVFDTNAPIVTPQWCNTIDNTPPSSAVQSLSLTQANQDFPVQWAGSDSGAGIGGYSIYVSTDSNPFTLWLDNTTDLSATFSGEPGRTYAFYSVARDLVGNTETVPSQPDTVTRVAGVGGEICGNCVDDNGDGKIDGLDADCAAAPLTVKKGVLNLVKPAPGDEKISLISSFTPATIAPPAEGIILSFIAPGTGTADPDVVLTCVQIPSGTLGWKTNRAGTQWIFKDTKGGPLGDLNSKEAVTIKYNAKKQQYDLAVTIMEAEVGMLTEGEVSTQVSIGSQGWENTQEWRLKAKGKQLATP